MMGCEKIQYPKKDPGNLVHYGILVVQAHEHVNSWKLQFPVLSGKVRQCLPHAVILAKDHNSKLNVVSTGYISLFYYYKVKKL